MRNEEFTAQGHYTANEVARLFMDIVPMAMRSYREQMRQCRGEAFTIPQFRLLAHLRRGPANNKELAENQGVSVAAMSRMVETLVARGLVQRHPLARDRRQVELTLTEMGEAAYQEVRSRAIQHIGEQMSLIDAEELSRVGEGLSNLRASLKNFSSPGGKVLANSPQEGQIDMQGEKQQNSGDKKRHDGCLAEL